MKRVTNRYLSEASSNAGYDEKHPAHVAAKALTKGWKVGHRRATYHPDGSATVAFRKFGNPRHPVSSASNADHGLQDLGGMHNHTEHALSNHTQIIERGKHAGVHVKLTGESATILRPGVHHMHLTHTVKESLDESVHLHGWYVSNHKDDDKTQDFSGASASNVNIAKTFPNRKAATEHARKRAKETGHAHSVKRYEDGKLMDWHHIGPIDEAIIESMADVEPILEAAKKKPLPTNIDALADDAGIQEGKMSAHVIGRQHGKAGNRLPEKIAQQRFGHHVDTYFKAVASGEIERAGPPPKKGLMARMFEGTNVSDETDTSRVKRKYLGSKRGRTATGKQAHAIEVMPVMAAEKPNNRTIPSKSK